MEETVTEKMMEVIQQVVRNVFEGMYFMFPETMETEDNPSLPKSCFKASVGIKNSPLKVVMYGSEKLVKDMAAAFLGTDQPVDDNDLVDVFKEATNLIGGNLVNTLNLDKGVGLDVPEVEIVETSGDLVSEPGTFFDVDGEFLKATVKG